MVEKEVTVKILTDVDDSQVEDLEGLLQQIVNGKLTIPVETDSSELEDIESRIEELEQKRADIYMGMDDTELEEVEAELDELETRRIELTGNVNIEGVDEAAQGLDDVGQSADNAASSLESMALLDIAGTLSQWGSQAESFAQELDNIAISSEQLAIQTGMTDSQMTGMLNHITNATFPRDEALMYVKSLDQIGVSAQNLGASATGLDRINDAFHLGAEKTNRLGQELSVLGVDMNNVSSSFNALAYANANTVGGMDNYFSFLQRYDAQFKELGMNVDQASVAIAAATQKFGGGRAALSGMNEALKNCNGDMSVLEQQLGLTAGSLSNASQLTGQYAGQLDAMADKEGEHKTLTQQLAAALDDVTASLSGTLSPFASFIGMIGNAGSFAVGINGLIQLTQTIKKAEMAQRLLNIEVLMNPYVWIAVAIIALVAALWHLYNTNEAVRNAFNHVGEALGRLWDKLTSALQPAIDAITQAWNGLMEALGIGGGDIFDGVIFFIVAFAEGLVALIDGVTWLIEGIQWLWEALSGFFGGTGNEGTIWLQTIIMVLMGPIGWILLLIQHWNQIAPAVSNALQGMYQSAVNWFNQTGQRISDFARNIVTQLRSAAINAVNSFISGVSALPGRVYDELAKTLDRVMDWGSQIVSRLGEIAQRAWQAFVSGLGIGSPGYIQILTLKELDDTGRRVPQVASRIVDNLGRMAGEAVDAWGTPKLDYEFGTAELNGGATGNRNTGTGTGNGQVVYNFNLYGDVDNEERMQRFVDAVAREIKWVNETAGRNMDL